jgi:predicted transcriptional regulator
MHTGILTTDPSTPARVVARLMGEQHVHALAVADRAQLGRPLGFVSLLDILKLVAEGGDARAEEIARTDVVTISASESLAWAAAVMVKHDTNHLIVVDPATGHPTGVLSSIDIAAAYGG